MPFFELFDETLDINATGNYSLLMQMDKDELSFAIIDNLRAKYILLRSYVPDNGDIFSIGEIKDILLEDDFLGKRYRSVKICLSSLKYSLVPSPIMDPAKKESLLGLSHDLCEEEVVSINRLDNPDAYLLFAVDRETAGLSDILTPGQPPVHYIKPFIANALVYAKRKSYDSVFLFVGQGVVTIAVVSNDILKFCNSYVFKNAHDILYYLLKVYKALGLSNGIPVYCSGKISQNDEIFVFLSEYIKEVLFINPVGNFSFSYVFDEDMLHRYINLFSLISCE